MESDKNQTQHCQEKTIQRSTILYKELIIAASHAWI